MSGLPALYTPLESLLLFQSLACYGVDTQVFARVSDLLTNNDAVKSAPTFNPDRLTPDALRDLYLSLLKEEARDELEPQSENEPPIQNGDSPSRKRKAPSPSLPSVQEAAQHQHLLPQLIAKLYARYRRHAIEEIREHEKRYDHYSRELRAIQNGEWDERLQREYLVNGTKEAPKEAPKESSPAEAPPNVAQPPAEVAPQEAQGPVKPPPTAPQASPTGSKEQSPTLSQQSQAPRRSSAKIESIINHPSGSPVNGSASPHQKSAAQSPVQPQAQVAPPPHQRTPSHPQPPQQPQQPLSRPPQQQPPHGPYPSPYGPPHTSPPVGSPTTNTVPITSRPPQGPQQAPPVILPPPHSMQNVQYPPPPLQVPSIQEGNVPYRPSSGSPHQQQQRPFPPGPPHGPPPHSPNAQPPPPHVQGPGYYPQYPGQHPYPPHQPMYHPPVQHPPMPPRGGGGGVILEPFQVMAQDPVQAHKAQERQMRQQQAAAARPPSRPQPSPRNAAATPVRPSQLPQPFHPSPAQHPLYPHPGAVPPVRRPPALRVNTRFASWKQSMPQEKPVTEWNPNPPSPITPERSPELQSSAPPSSTSKSKRAVKSKEMPAPDAAETPRPGRSSRKGARKARGTSVASSAVTGSVRGRTRSQSVASHADEPATDVKAEPSTPAETMESDAQSTTETPTSGGRRTRRRAGTLQSVPEQPQAANNKRKRDQREESETAEPEVPEVDLNMGTPGPPNFVVASRNFARMSVPVMNDIASHKHASLFSNPVKAKDAEGYYDIIHRPQDLKSIRTAITNGSRAVAAATQSNADTPSANSPGGAPSTPTQFSSTSTQITLPISEELVPPKGIVNSAQLEKELMRMFANAVMFNSGEDGVVSDAIEMARDVEASVANWRAAERTSVYDAASASTPAEGELDEGGAKRRKA